MFGLKEKLEEFKTKKRIKKIEKYYYDGFLDELERIYTAAKLYLQGDKAFPEETKKHVKHLEEFYESITPEKIRDDEVLEKLSEVKKLLPKFLKEFKQIVGDEQEDMDEMIELYEKIREHSKEFGKKVKQLRKKVK